MYLIKAVSTWRAARVLKGRCAAVWLREQASMIGLTFNHIIAP